MLYGCTLVDVADNLFDAIDTNLKQEGHCLVAEMVVKSEQEMLDRKLFTCSRQRRAKYMQSQQL